MNYHKIEIEFLVSDRSDVNVRRKAHSNNSYLIESHDRRINILQDILNHLCYSKENENSI